MFTCFTCKIVIYWKFKSTNKITRSVSAATWYQTKLKLELNQVPRLLAIVEGRDGVKVVVIIKGHRKLSYVYWTLNDGN